MFSGDEWLHLPTHGPIALDRPSHGRHISRLCIGLLALSALGGSALLLTPVNVRTSHSTDVLRGWATRLDSLVRGTHSPIQAAAFEIGDLYRPNLPAEIDVALRGTPHRIRHR